MMPTESCNGVSTWNVRPYMSGDIRSATGTRTDVTNLERSPYATSSFASSFGLFDAASAAAGVCAFAVSAAPSARPARAALFFRNPRRPRVAFMLYSLRILHAEKRGQYSLLLATCCLRLATRYSLLATCYARK